MTNTEISSIIANCLSIDSNAAEAYQRLADAADDPQLRDFWNQMAGEETTHIDYWKTLAALANRSSLPQVFDEPATVLDELTHLADKSRTLLEEPIENLGLKDAFILAYRLEFFMLHPAFETLFHALRSSTSNKSPEDEYEEHVDRFIAMLSIYDHLTPEFQLISETLKRLWKENKKLAHQAMKDPLTGLFNRRGFLQISEQLLYVARRGRNTICLLMIDIDDFKAINDSLGHLQGDSVLKGVADRLVGAIRASDVVARFGGEEFVVLLFATGSESIAALAEKIRNTVSGDEFDGNRVTVSVGASNCIVPTDVDRDLRHLIRTADRRMYLAKAAGKNRVVHSD
ncbi:diguanylate cyclase/phosphodiesterase (GGDEF & EAL domains) with PAS/PAC sensor(s) [Olavius algarvensis associated proteobacterium Delta 3]|nr:diguanylate cyclase/phosphodiesterase (GGDEF & EAL domains) with PAS/PAC sensor(s) [Olavius algarvensis associated proteobacterium Delta 3]